LQLVSRLASMESVSRGATSGSRRCGVHTVTSFQRSFRLPRRAPGEREVCARQEISHRTSDSWMQCHAARHETGLQQDRLPIGCARRGSCQARCRCAGERRIDLPGEVRRVLNPVFMPAAMGEWTCAASPARNTRPAGTAPLAFHHNEIGISSRLENSRPSPLPREYVDNLVLTTGASSALLSRSTPSCDTRAMGVVSGFVLAEAASRGQEREDISVLPSVRPHQTPMRQLHIASTIEDRMVLPKVGAYQPAHRTVRPVGADHVLRRQRCAAGVVALRPPSQ